METGPRFEWLALLSRAACLYAFWVIIAGTKIDDLVAGLFVAVPAAFVSLHLLGARQGRVRPLVLLHLALRFVGQSILAGFDVARRALHPRLPINPGFVTYESRSPTQEARAAFCTMTSLLPGTLPTDVDDRGRVLIHCLDTTQPVVSQLASEEALFRRAFGDDR